MKYLLDTDIVISFLKNKHKIPEKIESVGIDNCFLSEITIVELTFGAYHSNNFSKHILEVKKIEKLFEVIPIYGHIEQFGKEKSRLRKDGILIPDFDLLIGTCAVANSMAMITNNVKHLGRIQSITIENWRNSQWNKFIK